MRNKSRQIAKPFEDGPRDYRVMGRWSKTRRTFLITLGASVGDCRERLVPALEDYTFEDVRGVGEFWLERWRNGRWDVIEKIRPLQVQVAFCKAKRANLQIRQAART